MLGDLVAYPYNKEVFIMKSSSIVSVIFAILITIAAVIGSAPYALSVAEAQALSGAANCQCQGTFTCSGKNPNCTGNFVGCTDGTAIQNCNVNQDYCGTGGTCDFFKATGANTEC